MIGISPPARTALLVAGAFAQIAILRPHNSREGVALAVGLLVLAAATAFRPDPTPRGRIGFRSWLAAAILVASVAFTVRHLDPTDTSELGRSLTLVLVATQIAQALVMRTIRDAGLSCALVAVMLVAAGMFATNASVGFALVPAALALTAAVLLLYDDHLASLSERHLGNRPPPLRRVMAPMLGVGIAAAVALLLISNVFSLGTEAQFRTNQTRAADGTTTRVGGSAGSGALDLNDRSTPDDTPELALPASAPDYLEGSIYDYFDGTTWQITDVLGQDVPWSQSVADGTVGQVPAPASADRTVGQGDIRTDTIQVLRRGGIGVAFAPGRVLAYAGPGRVASDGNGAPRLIAGGPRPSGIDTYTVTSTTPAATPTDPPQQTTGPEPGDARWLQLPPVLPGRIPALATSITAGTTSRATQVAAIENYLRTHEQYQLDAPLPRNGDDPISDFLFVSHRGFCEQFAAADVVLLRSLGIPARLVTGYAFGDTASKPGTRIMRSKDLHAWVQVWYPGTGWVSSDPTADAALADANAAPRRGTFDRLRSLFGNLPGGAITVVAVLGGAAALALLTVLVRRRRPAHRADVRGRPDGPVFAAFLRWEDRLRRADLGRRRDESLREFRTRLQTELATGAPVEPAVLPGDLDDAFAALEAECYAEAGRPLDPDRAANAVATFERLAALPVPQATSKLTRV